MEIIDNIKKLRHKVYRSYYCLKPIEKKKIILWANSFKQYGCSPKYITEYLLLIIPILLILYGSLNVMQTFQKN